MTRSPRIHPLLAISILLVGVLSVSLVTSVVRAGPHAGGSLLVHVMEGAYSGDINYCGVAPISSCDEVVSRIEDASSPFAWAVYAVFPESTEPERRSPR